MEFNFNIFLILRGVQALFAIIVLGLTAYAVNRTLGFNSTINFNLFCSIWTFFIAVPYLVLAPIYFPAAAHQYALIGVDAVTMIFWFAGFIALGSMLPPPQYCHGGCGHMQAATVFGSFEWVLFLAAVVLVVLPLVRNRGSGVKANATVETQPGV